MSTVEMTTEELQAGYRLAREEGNSARYVQLYEEWFHRKAAEGEPPDALRRDQGTPEERFWARVVQGPDGHLFWDSKHTPDGRPYFESGPVRGCLAQRFAWRLKHGSLSNRLNIWTTCGAKHCVNVEHLAVGWKPRGGKAMVTDDQLIARVRAYALRLGHPPNTAEYDRMRPRDAHSASGLGERFGGWGGVMERAGLEWHGNTTVFEERYSDEGIANDLRELAAALGHAPSTGEWQEAGLKPGRTWISKRFGGWHAALKLAGITLPPGRKKAGA